MSANFVKNQKICIRGARVNNLKNINLDIPKNKLVVITGLSGSGKSSLAFDTLFAEGHRMYIESLSAYSRQFLGKIEKPDIDKITGLSPAIAIQQKTVPKNSRSTVGTVTEIYDFLKILFARIGETFSPVSNKKVIRYSVKDILDHIIKLPKDIIIHFTFPIKINNKNYVNVFKNELTKGYSRFIHKSKIIYIEDFLKNPKEKIFKQGDQIDILLTKIKLKKSEESYQQISQFIENTLYEGKGLMHIQFDGKKIEFSDQLESDGIHFEVPSVNLFNFNNPYGSCTVCSGLGKIIDIDETKVIPNTSLSIEKGAIVPFQSPSFKKWLSPLIENHKIYNIPINIPYADLNTIQKDIIWNGFKEYLGIHKFFEFVKKNTYKIQFRILISKYRGEKTCNICRGTRLRKDAQYVKINDKSIVDLLLMPIRDLASFFENLKLTKNQLLISNIVLLEIQNRLKYIKKVGLEYLTLSRASSTLSGGEYQRINLSTALGSTLVGTLYILDEPTVGLHPRDTHKLCEVLLSLRDMGNSVIVVEHEEEVMKCADYIVDIGPGSGINGGEIVFEGTPEKLQNNSDTLTTRYLNKIDEIKIPSQRRAWSKSFTIHGARENNLKNINVTFPLNILTVVTGVSGSGKSSLISKIVYPAIAENLFLNLDKKGLYDYIDGDLDEISEIQFVDQKPISRSSRSNSVTYIKAYDLIRNLLSKIPLAKQRGYKPSTFSFNVYGGRCENCFGEGYNKIEMQFLADVHIKCEVCKGFRFNSDVLEVKYQNKNIYEILNLSVDESLDFFKHVPEIVEKIKPLSDVGLGYIKLGQSTSGLSGGEAQRLKLSTYLKNPYSDLKKTLFIFDEPTTGLHIHDIKKLLLSINHLVNLGHSVIVIEHNLDIIKGADWIIDIGPDQGDKGGEIVFTGVPEDMIKLKNNFTAKYLKEKF